MPATVVYLFILIELIAVSYIDIRQKKVHNWWVLLNIVFYFLFLILFKDSYFFNLKTFVVPAMLLITGIALYKVNIMGGGDVKFLFSFFLLIPVVNHQEVLLYLLGATISVAMVLLLAGTFIRIKEITAAAITGGINEVLAFYGRKFAFAPVILLAWICLGVVNRDLIF